MKNLFLVISCLFCATSGSAQQNEKADCNFLKNLHYKNGIDTITILARKTENGRLQIDTGLKDFAKNKNLKISDFKSGIGLKLVDCPQEYYVPMIDNSKEALDLWRASTDEILSFRCIVFEGYYHNSEPLFIVDKITRK